jgi:hypothetical protein
MAPRRAWVLHRAIATGASRPVGPFDELALDDSGGKEVVMVTRNTHGIWTIVAFGLLALAAGYWSYIVKQQQRASTTVVIEQLREPAWAVEVRQVAADEEAQQ